MEGLEGDAKQFNFNFKKQIYLKERMIKINVGFLVLVMNL